ncbi:MAG: hypothetical protein C4521_02305 [Actinobacteria bacterium]|nr:MAG: hypothetical protein C4521_02305 [Actinomycetota bacterium]
MNDNLLRLLQRKAVQELGDLCERISACAGEATAVAGSGNPVADVVLVKASPSPEEEQSARAFSGQAGEVVTKSMQRLELDSSLLYLTNLAKCSRHRDSACAARCGSYLAEELLVVQPRVILLMGEPAYETVRASYGLETAFAPGLCERVQGGPLLVATVDFASAMKQDASKRALWRDFQVLAREYKKS